LIVRREDHVRHPLHPSINGPDLRRLRYFVAVAEELSFTRAAERLFVAQQPVSAAVRKLELELGTRLFDRSPRRVVLTAAGEALLPKARTAIAAADAAYAAVRSLMNGVAGVFRLGVSPGSYSTAAPIMDDLASSHPNVEFEVRSDATARLLADLRAQRLDVIVGASAPATPRLMRQLLRLDQAELVLHPRHPLAGRRSVGFAELRDDTFLVAPDTLAPGYNEALLAFCADAGFTPKTLVAPGLLAPPGVPPEQWILILTSGAAQAMQLDFEPVRVSLDPPRFFRIELIWRIDTDPGLISSFRSAAGDVAHRMRWTTHSAAA
jgi:DNA-binding transcriptional LysR family regulator